MLRVQLNVITRLLLLLCIFFTILTFYFLYILTDEYLGETIIYEFGDKPLFKTSVPMFYINLDISNDRRRYMEKAFKDTGTLIRVRAVDGRSDLLEDYITSESGNFTQVIEKHKCTRCEAALTASHIFAAKKAFDSGAAAALILEDDASPMAAPFWTVGLDEVVKNANKEHPGWQLLWLQYGDKDIFHKLIESWKNDPERLFLSTEKFHSYGAVAYLISIDGMRFLIDKFIDKDGRFIIFDRGGYCRADWVLKITLREIYYKTPPMFTTRIHEDTTGVRSKSGGPHNDKYMLHLEYAAEAYSWIVQDYEIKTSGGNVTEALRIFPIRLWSVI